LVEPLQQERSEEERPFVINTHFHTKLFKDIRHIKHMVIMDIVFEIRGYIST